MITATAISKRYRRGARTIVALPPTTLTIAAGELVAVRGASLSGKTTLVNLLAGWTEPDEGTIEWDAVAGARPTWREVAVVPQAFALLDELTVFENVTLGGSESVDGLLESLGLGRLRDRTTSEISVGERQRVMVARALAARPSVVLADEPVAHQDVRHASAVLDCLTAGVNAGAACLIATRDAEIAAKAGRCLLLEDSD